MNNFKRTLLCALILAHMTSEKCEQGTLKCNTTGANAIPEICDFIFHYQLNRNNMKCEIKKVDGCQLTAFDDDTLPCLMCETGMVFDAKKTKCEGVADGKKRENCTRYDGSTSACIACSADLYLSHGECLAVGDVKVANCEVYESDVECLRCESGFYLKEKKCVKYEEISDCYSHTPRQCLKCVAGYIINPGFSAQTILTKAFLTDLSNLTLSSSKYQTVSNMGTDCQEVRTKNCAEPADSLTCSKCNSSYYLDDKKQCQRFPDAPLDFCKIYSNSNTCYRCEANYYMKEANVCGVVTAVTSCRDYVWNKDECEACVDGYLLLESGQCHERTLKIISNCKNLSTTKDQCDRCRDSFSLTKDFKACFADVPNCKNQEDGVTAESLKHQCTQCDTNYYIDGGFCKLKTVASCKEYESNSNTCKTCDDGYYLLSNTCLKTEISFCKEYEVNTNRCKKCDDGYHQDVSKCLLQNVANCKTYVLNSGSCDVCQDNFYLALDGKCMKNTVTGCKTFRKNTDVCDECHASHWHDTGANKCNPQNVSNCAKYRTQSSICERCVTLYFLDDVANKCKPSNISNCKTYQVNSNDCLVCDDFFYLSDKSCKAVDKVQCKIYKNNENKCLGCGKGYFSLTGDCHKQSITHCVSYTDNSNECLQCAGGYYMKDSVCATQNLSHCQSYNDNKNECSGCQKGYYVTSITCTGQSIGQCKTYQDGQNKCNECNTGYYYNADKSGCVAKTIGGCSKFTNALNESKCEECDNLKKLNGDKTTCTAITNSSNCFKSDGKTDVCLECSSNFFFQGAVCSGTRMASHLDSNCASNKETVLNTKCASCGNSKSLMAAGSGAVSKTFLSTNNCLKIDPATGACSQCKDLFQFNVSNACVAAATPEALKCKRMKNNHGSTALSENLKCEECRDRALYFLESEVCKDRVKSNLITGCGIFVKDEDKCLACESGKIGKEPKAIASCQLVSGLSLSPAVIPSCKIRENNDKCQACLQGYYLNAEKTACSSPATSSKISMAFTTGMHSFGSIQDASAEVENCALYAQVDEVTLGCVKCNANFVGIVSEPKSDNTDAYRIASHKDSLTGLKNYSNAFSECFPGNQPYRIDATNKHINDNECAIGYRVDSKAGFACLRTIDSKKGRFAKITHDATGAALGKTIWGIGNTRNLQNERSELTNIDYKIFHKMERLLFSTYMPFTNCATDNLLYMMIIDLSDPFITFSKIKEHTGNYLEQVHCMGQGSLTNTVIPNCGISAITADQDEAINLGTTKVKHNHCIACKPGFKATITGPSVTACTAIADCDPSTSTWLDACETPQNDAWTSKSIDSMELIAYDVPVPLAKKITDCLVVNIVESTPRCIMCNAGYKVENKNCVTTEIADSKCAKRSIGTTDILVPQIAKRKRGTFNGFIYSRINSNIGEFGANTGLGCNVCEENYVPRVDTTTLVRTCQSHSTQSAIVQNCDNIDYNDFQTCHDCQGSRVISPIDKSCVDISSMTECIAIKVDPGNALQTICSQCNSGFYLDSGDNTCKTSNCEAYSADDPTECILCNTGMTPDATDSKVKCGAIALVNDPCDSYSQKLGTCGRCKESSKFLYVVKTMKGSTLLHIGFECITFSLTGQGFGNYNLDFPYVEIVYDKSNSQMTSAVKGLMTKDQKERTYSTSAVDVDPAANHCVTSRSMSNCKSDSNIDGLYCKKCSDTYNVNNNNLCFPSPVEFCKVAYLAEDGTNKCTSCLNSHYINPGGTQCLARSVSKFCKTFELAKDECQNCPPDRYKTGSKGCDPYTAQFCSEYTTGEDKCQTCETGHYKDASDSDKCKPHTVENCNGFKNDKNECTKCVANYIKDIGQQNKCVFYTANNCASFNISQDKCQTCIANHYKNTSDLDKCAIFTARNCKDYQAAVDACGNCKDFHYKDSGGKCVLYTAENCADYESNKDECDNCSTNYFKDADDANKCKLNTAKNCQNPKTTKNECQDCLPFFYMDIGDANKCKEYTAEHCDSLTSGKNECNECVNLYYKDAGDKICKKNTASDCYTYSKTVNQCAVCIQNFYKDSNTGMKCIPNTAAHCLEKNKDKNECSTCKAGFLKKTAGGGAVTCEFYKAANCNGFQSDKDECLNCATGYWKDSGGASVLCKLRKNSNCNGFEEGMDKCTSCNQGTYFVTGTCVHVALVNNCKTYSVTENVCTGCFDQFFKDPSTNNCWPFPNGVKNCLSYSSATKCETCGAEYVYNEDNNFCTKIESPIVGCQVHNKSDECSQCMTGRVLINNQCPEITAQNCLTYQNFDKCSGCKPNHIFNAETGACPSSGISNCIEAEKGAEKNLCISCGKGTFISQTRESCDSPTKIILGCVDYETQEKCKECGPNKLLSADGKKCSDIKSSSGAHCVDAKEIVNLICEICSPGFKRDGLGKCAKISIANCLVSSENDSKCELCLPGTYMDEKGVCNPFQAPVEPQSVVRFCTGFLMIVGALLVV